MTPDEFKRLAASIPKPTADAIHVHSRQETEALREFVDCRPCGGRDAGFETSSDGGFDVGGVVHGVP